ncbi:MAG: hypothetical protein K0Q72_284 [Armatimonadetes bacterium]|jgi:hypothetical protein|nr:hypothetical protein [Armatimonadota bacterium]
MARAFARRWSLWLIPILTVGIAWMVVHLSRRSTSWVSYWEDDRRAWVFRVNWYTCEFDDGSGGVDQLTLQDVREIDASSVPYDPTERARVFSSLGYPTTKRPPAVIPGP